MQGRAARLAGHPQPKHRAPGAIEQVGKIFRPERGLIQPLHLLAPQQLLPHRRHQGRELGVVVHGGGNAAVVHPGLTAMAFAQGLHGVFDPGRQLGMEFRVQAAHRAQQAHVVGDHVERLATFYFAKADHHGMEGIELAADRLLQATHHPRRNPDGIGGLVGPGAMAALPQHLHLQLTRRGRQAAAAHADRAGRQAWEDMDPKQGFHPLHGAIGPHPGGALRRFLGGLKQQPHPGTDLGGIALPERPQQLGHTKAHHRVHVVAAGVHQALVHRGVIEAGALFHRQGIHVHPQGHQGHPGP